MCSFSCAIILSKNIIASSIFPLTAIQTLEIDNYKPKHKSFTMNKNILLIMLSLFAFFPVKADEGMWLPMFIERLNYVDMQNEGLQLTPDEIYSINNSSMKDAVVAMGGGFCTGEIISNEGLFLTNHHCGFGSIQELSTPENNLLQDGFFSKSKSEEIPVEGLFVHILSYMDDVTDRVLKGVSDALGESERKAIIAGNIALIKEENEINANQKVYVKSFYYGSEYYLFVYDVYSDIRFVAAPPQSIGKFGGDTDNWMWPRHTGDFSFFRIYASPENEAAEYNENNIPFQPKYFFPISMEGTPESSFSMVLGYPGSTDRFLTSYGIQNELELKQPAIVKIRTEKLSIIKEGMDSDTVLKLQYASKYAKTSNYWKYYIGQQEQLKRNRVVELKEKEENEFREWVKADADRTAKYGEALNDIASAENQLKEYILPITYFKEAIYRTDINKMYYKLYGLKKLLQKEAEQKNSLSEDEQIELKASIDAKAKAITEGLEDYYKNYNESTAQKVYAALLQYYYDDLGPEYHSDKLDQMYKKYKGDLLVFAQIEMMNSKLSSKENLKVFLQNPDYKTFEKDPMFQIFEGTYKVYGKSKNAEAKEKLNRGMRLYVEGMRMMNADEIYYPDANSTLRMSYGQIKSYNPEDGAKFYHFTTLKGVMDKEDDSKAEFTVSPKLKELYAAKDYGKYADKDNSMHVCFLSDNDITGGNSGSPVINGKGHIIGVAFDGNWEAMSGDISFEQKIQRTISVDIRYVLFVIDKLGGAGQLVDEMQLIYPSVKEEVILEEGENEENVEAVEGIPTI